MEYRGRTYREFAGALAFIAVAGTIVMVTLAVRGFKDASALDVVLTSCCIAALPFVVDWLLRVNGTQLNVHGFAVLGYVIYAFGSEACAIGLFTATAVRAMRSEKRHGV